jgi:BMFP domain-containing protein YqiC
MADAPQPKRKTIAALEAALADLEARRKHAMDAADTYKRAAVAPRTR